MEQYCAQVDANGVVTSVIVCDDVNWAVSRLGGEWLFCGTYLPGVGQSREEVLVAIDQTAS